MPDLPVGTLLIVVSLFVPLPAAVVLVAAGTVLNLMWLVAFLRHHEGR